MTNRLLRTGMLSTILVFALAATVVAAGTPAGTVITNSAIVTYNDANGNPMTPVHSNTVTTVVKQVAGVDVSPEGANKTAVAGETLNVPFQITNTGNGPDSYALALSGAPAGYTAAIIKDDNCNGVLDPAEATIVTNTGDLAADGAFFLIVQVSVPSSAADQDTATIKVSATSSFNGGVSDYEDIHIVITQAHLVFSKSASVPSPKPGDEIVYTITIINDGSDAATNVVLTDTIPHNVVYIAESMTYDDDASDAVPAVALTDAPDSDRADFGHTLANAITVSMGDIAPHPNGASSVITFRVRVGDTVPSGASISNIASIAYGDGAGHRLSIDSTSANSTVSTKAGVDLQTSAIAIHAFPGDVVTVPFSVKNTGNADDTIDIEVSSTMLDWVIWIDFDGNGIIDNGDIRAIDSDGDGRPDTGPLHAGGTYYFLIVSTVPVGTYDAASDDLVVTAISTNDTSASDTAQVATTVHAPVLTVAKSVSPQGSQAPGQILTYILVVTNTGSGIAKDLVITDVIPAHTTYVPGTIKVNGVPKTDDIDGDGARFAGGAVVARWSQLVGNGATVEVVFQVKID